MISRQCWWPEREGWERTEMGVLSPAQHSILPFTRSNISAGFTLRPKAI